METPITRAEHEEFRRSMELSNQILSEENNRQNKRIEVLEDFVKEQTALTVSVEKLATNMENMLKEQKNQGERLETLEARDGQMWRKIVGYIATTVIGLILGFVFKQVGI